MVRLVIAGTGALPRRSRRGYAPSQRQFPTVVSLKHRLCKRRRTGDDPSVAECPTTGGSSVRPDWKQSVARCGNHTPTTGQILVEKVTPSPSKSAELPVANTTLGVRVRQRRGVPGWPLPGDCPVTGHSPIPTVCWLGSLQPCHSQFSGAVGFGRGHADEDVKNSQSPIARY